ncbi:oocyte zinc finger protein XlCOF8.4-like isoform X3 [Acipenser ruthenus]|nr:oocyte zinc finger protein XlCOF8.4-like isoform X3 [Acipenser ruthenus]XP_058867196.1 oocyte zinc finger protein XlCOF8.4-like isoform X3 [Acipenser ruthenus]XP_058867197.1 oocyte zinc finger protein XlCOF8.4-like isoform X3 [Acipenser ruthenus]
MESDSVKEVCVSLKPEKEELLLLPDGVDRVIVMESPAPVSEVREVAQPSAISRPYLHENLQCYQCFITFCNSKAKERHMKKSHREEYKQQLQSGDTLFTCYVCERTFPSSQELTQHQGSHTKEDKPFKCASCEQSFRTFSEVTAHRRSVCREKPCVCPDCGHSCRTPALLRAHRQSHRGGEGEAEKTHRCGKCGALFESEVDLIVHQEKHAGQSRCNGNSAAGNANAGPRKKRGRPPKASRESDEEEEEEEEEEEGKNKGGGGSKTPKRAKKQPAPIPAPEGEQNDSEGGGGGGGDDDHADDNSEDASEPKSGRRGRPAKGKERKNPAPAPSACPECGKSFATAALLKTHQRLHRERKAHPCADCDESFGKPEQLSAHQQRAHSGERHTCAECGKSFSREGNLKAHQRTHSATAAAADSAPAR